MKFGVLLRFHKYDTVSKVTSELEKLGFDSVWIYDHLIVSLGSTYPYAKPPRSALSMPCLEGWTILCFLASETSRIRLGTLTLCNSFRYPSVLAKMSATFDVISRGRLEFGIGAGYWRREYEMYGIPFPNLSIRIEQLRESIQIIKNMWTEETTSFNGKYYTVNQAINNPKPIQKPHPPIVIGGKSEKLLKIAAEFADNWNFPFAIPITPDEYRRKVYLLEQCCLEVNRTPKDVIKSLGMRCIIGRDEKEVKEKAKRLKPEWESWESFMKRLIGTPEECIEKLNAFKEVGVEYFIITFLDIPDLKSLQLFAEEVMPAIR